MPSISTSVAVQQSANSQLLITGIGTDFASGVTASSGAITGSTLVGDNQVQLAYAAPAGPVTVTFTDRATGATCTVLVTALPILELIRQNLVAAIGQISQANGYFTNPAVQELAQANSDADQLIVVGLGESQLIKPPAMKVYLKQTFYALCYVLPADGEAGAAAAVDPRLTYLYADVFAAVYDDRTRGGYAYDTVIQPPQFESNAAEAQFRVVVPIHVLYRTLENNPTAQG